MAVDTCRTGQISELKAQVWLLEQGYEVFSNVKPAGPVDLIVWNPETSEVILIDVKTVRPIIKADGAKVYTNSTWTKPDGVRLLFYCPEEDRLFWSAP